MSGRTIWNTHYALFFLIVLRYRLLTAFVLMPIVLGAAILGDWWLFVVLGVGLILCGYEYFTMLPAGGYTADRAIGLALITALLLDALLNLGAARIILLAVVILPPLWELRRRTHQGFLVSWALTALGVLYIGGVGAHVFLLRALPGTVTLLGIGIARGAVLLIITLLATWATDTTAYFVGTTWGRHPFFPEISPKKTWEGAIGGIVGAAIAFGVLTSLVGVNPVWASVGGIGVGIAGTWGDLVESLIKRQVGVKDSGSLLLGHGGVLDRLDSMLFTMLFAYYFFVAVLR